MAWFRFIPVLVLGLVLISLVTAIRSKSRVRIVVALLLLCVAGGLFFVRATMMPDRRYDPRRSMRYPRYYPDVETVEPPATPDARLTAAEDQAVLRMLQSMPATVPTLPPPPGDIVLPTDPPMYPRTQPPTSAPATQPTSGKLWVDNWTAFLGGQRRDQQFVRTYVTTPAVDADEARQLAYDAAVRSLRPLIEARLSAQRRGWNGDVLEQQIRAALVSGELIADQFSQPITKAYGTLWQHDLLLDASPARLDAVVRRVGVTTAQVQARQLTVAGSVAGIAAVTGLLYLFLNFATRGYFVWRLRAAAVMVVILTLLVVMMRI